MAISKMSLVNIESDETHLEDVLLKFSQLDNFHPIPASKIVETVGALTTLQEENPYKELLVKFEDVCLKMGIKTNIVEMDKIEFNIEEKRKYIKELVNKFESMQEVKKELNQVIEENEVALQQLEYLNEMDNISLDDVFSCKYVKVRFGRLPKNNVDKLKYYNTKPFAFKSFSEDNNYRWCMYVTPNRFEGEVDNIFSSLYFERIRIPDFIHGIPNSEIELLMQEIKDDNDQLFHVETEIEKWRKKVQVYFDEYYTSLKHLDETYESRKYVVGFNKRISIVGFVPKKEVYKVKEVFKEDSFVEVQERPAHSDYRLKPPTKLKNNWFVRPFEMFVEMYGVPAYEDIDPTPFVALTYSLLFGMMFGDLGQGLLLSLIGYIAYKWKGMQLGEIGIRIGLTSAFFGLCYGSFFGNEEILTPFFTNVLGLEEKPIEVLSSNFTMTLLLSAVAIGAILIITSICINIYIQKKRGNIGELLFSQNGVAGLLFYSAVLIGVALTIGKGIFIMTPMYIILLIVVPLLLIFFKEPLCLKIEGKDMFPDGIGGFITQSIFELLEVCLTFLANTMSFLRVGGFVLSHAGMMLVVMTISQMVGSSMSLFVIVVGNIFVMVLEGMIVGIQVLRLEFYEMFSRYFEGEGIAFKPMIER